MEVLGVSAKMLEHKTCRSDSRIIRRHGYVRIHLDGNDQFAHRLIWTIQTGDEPPNIIDHVNGIPSDNRWLNLREATAEQNLSNRGMTNANTSGAKGVWWHKEGKKWCATIRANGKVHYLGLFSNIDDAASAYRQAAIELHGDFRNE